MKGITRKNLISICCLVLVASLLITVGAVITISMPMTAHVDSVSGYTITVASTPYTSGQTIAWGTVTTGTYTKTVNIQNTGNSPLAVAFVASGLSSGWTLTSDLPASVGAYATVSGTLTLTVPANVPAGDYSFSATITLT